MKTRVYRAETLKDALARIRRDLGGSALILGTKESSRRGFLSGAERPVIEVTAAVGVDPKRPNGPSVRLPSRWRLGGGSDQRGLDERLDRLRRAAEGLSEAGCFEHLVWDVPTALLPAYSKLRDLEVPDRLARRIARFMAGELGPSALKRPEAIARALRLGVEACLPIAPPIVAVPGQRRVLALVGPTGSGKTTAAAKLAARAKLGFGLRVGLLAIDTRALATVEPLRTYAEILDSPLSVADDAERVASALDALGAVDLALIDTPGRAARDALAIQALAARLAPARADEIHLVVSAARGVRDLNAAVAGFQPLGFDRLLPTKLDEAAAPGALLAALERADRPIAYISTGQAVPDGLEAADRSRLASWILGEELRR